MDTNTILNEASERMQKAIDHLEEELLNIRAGKASPNVLNGVMVEYYGSQSPVSGVASVTVPDAKTILIQPWDKNMLRPIEKAIIDSNIGLTPSNNGEQIRLSIPPLTEERRKDLVKQVRGEAETGRISLRNARRDALEAFKKAQKEGMPEDEAKDGETRIQKVLEKYTKLLDAALDRKEKEIMTVCPPHAAQVAPAAGTHPAAGFFPGRHTPRPVPKPFPPTARSDRSRSAADRRMRHACGLNFRHISSARFFILFLRPDKEQHATPHADAPNTFRTRRRIRAARCAATGARSRNRARRTTDRPTDTA